MLGVLDPLDYVIITILVLIITLIVRKPGATSIFENRLRRIEEGLDRIASETGVEMPNPHDTLVESARDLAELGEKIKAIKAQREETGMGLKESKEAVENYLASTVTRN